MRILRSAAKSLVRPGNRMIAVAVCLLYVHRMKTWLALLSLLMACATFGATSTNSAAGKTVMIIPIHDNIAPPLLYLVRRGVKQAIEEHAELLVLDIKTYGGRIDTTEDIFSVLSEFKGDTVAYVNDRAISAGAFIAVATKQIYMAPQ